MEIIRNTVRVIRKRPMVLWFMGIVILVCHILNQWNPLSSIIASMYFFSDGDLLQSVVSLLRFILNPSILPLVLLGAIALVLLGGLVAGVVFSGYFVVLHNAVENKSKVKNEFFLGFKKNFLRFSLIFMRIFGIGFLLLIFLMVASVPAVVATKTASATRFNILVAAVFIDFLTVLVVSFGWLFYQTYTLFWIPAACFHGRKPFVIGKRVADRNFWHIAGSLVLFDVIFVVLRYLLAKLTSGILFFLLNWLFQTIFFMVLCVFVFSAFKKQVDSL